MLVMWLAGCDGGKDDTVPPPTTTETGTPAPTGETGGPPPGPELVLGAPGYTLTTSWTIPSVDVRAAFDLVVRWGDLTTDAWGAAVTPSKVPRLVLLETIVPDAELPARLATDDLGTDLLSVWQADVSGEVFANLTDLAYASTPFSPSAFLLEEPGKTWVVGLADTDGVRLDPRLWKVIVPTGTSPATAVDLVDGESSFTWSATFDGTPLETSEGLAPDYTIAWGDLATDALGKEYDADRGDVLFVARFDDESAQDLGALLFDLEARAEGYWTMDVAGEDEARLELARDDGGAGFPGFTAGSTWVVGVRCSTCFSPFPLWATVVDVR